MLIVFYGANEIRVRDALSAQLDSLKEADPAIVTIRVEEAIPAVQASGSIIMQTI